jgi:ParB/RepB/Spo0J family partition protein
MVREKLAEGMVGLMSEQVHNVALSQIDVDWDWNCRTNIDEKSVATLTLSLEEHGQEQPVVLRETGGGRYFLVSGFRRMRAAMNLKWEFINAFVRELSEYEARMANWRENGEREQLSFWEEVMFVKNTFPDEIKISQIQKDMGKNYDWCRARRQIWNLPDSLIDLARRGIYLARDINDLLKRDPVQQEAAARAAALAEKRGENAKGIRKGSLTRRHVQGRKNMARMMNIIEQKSLSSDPRVHDILLWASGDLTCAELAGRLKVDEQIFRTIEE